MSNRRKARRCAGRCDTCGEPYSYDARRFAVAVHNCETGEWDLMPRAVAAYINSMSNEQLAAAEDAPAEFFEVLRVIAQRSN
jgi:hypothetical protein